MVVQYSFLSSQANSSTFAKDLAHARNITTEGLRKAVTTFILASGNSETQERKNKGDTIFNSENKKWLFTHFNE